MELARQEWMAVLAKAPEERLATAWAALEAALGEKPAFGWLRRPETGAVMVRGRAGGTGAPFNLGEMTVTRCALRLASGVEGHAYVPGRTGAKAEQAALCDALMQVPELASQVTDLVIRPLTEAAAAEKSSVLSKAAATKVDFFTRVRGENS